MKHLIIGLGEVGAALKLVLGCDGYDVSSDARPPKADEHYDILHICIPYSERFKDLVDQYQRFYAPRYTVIHSTVPIGTSAALGAFHSPIRGRHPQLALSIRTFTKYVGGGEGREAVASELRRFGIPAVAMGLSADTEAGKLIDLMQYGAMILLEKEIHAFCMKHELDFDVVYRSMNESYNAGYAGLGHPEFVRPVLTHKEGKIGGHCVVQNMPLLETETANRIITKNETL